MAQGKTDSRSTMESQPAVANGSGNGTAANGELARNGSGNGVTGEVTLEQVSDAADNSVEETEGMIPVETSAEAPAELAGETAIVDPSLDADPAETEEWLESLRYVLESKGPQRVNYLLAKLNETAFQQGVELPFSATTPYINSISADEQPAYPGNREIERRIKSIIRWNAMAMVVRANREQDGIGGHISTYASAATLYEVAFNHFFKGRGDDFSGRSGLHSGPRLAGHLRAGVSGRPIDGRPTHQFPPGIAAGRGPVELSASVADADVLGIPDGLDGSGPDHGDLPGAVQ